MNNLDLSTFISIEEAQKILTADCGKRINEDVFDIYGNYNYPFEEKISTPNTAVGSMGDY